MRFLFASWPEEPYLVAELWEGTENVGAVLWRSHTLRLETYGSGVDLEALQSVIDEIVARLRDNRTAIEESGR